MKGKSNEQHTALIINASYNNEEYSISRGFYSHNIGVLNKKDFNVIDYKCSLEDNRLDDLRKMIAGKKISLLWIRAHGQPGAIELFRDKKITGGNIGDYFSFITENLSDTATILLDSCNTGKIDKDNPDTNNMQFVFARETIDKNDVSVVAPSNASTYCRFEINNGQFNVCIGAVEGPCHENITTRKTKELLKAGKSPKEIVNTLERGCLERYPNFTDNTNNFVSKNFISNGRFDLDSLLDRQSGQIIRTSNFSRQVKIFDEIVDVMNVDIDRIEAIKQAVDSIDNENTPLENKNILKFISHLLEKGANLDLQVKYNDKTLNIIEYAEITAEQEKTCSELYTLLSEFQQHKDIGKLKIRCEELCNEIDPPKPSPQKRRR